MMLKPVVAIVLFSLVCNATLANSILPTDRSSTVTYSLDRAIEAPVAFAHSAEDILLVKDMDGNFFAPKKHFNNLSPLHPGWTYQVVITKPVELIWNQNPENVLSPSHYYQPLKPKHFKSVEPTLSDMSILVTGLPPEGEIGIVTERGICIGAAAFSNQEWIGVAVWGQPPNSKEINGANNGELFQIILKDNEGKQLNNYEILEGDDRFKPDELTVIRLLNKDDVDSLYGILPYHPNPFSSYFHITINLKDTCVIDLSLFDINGKKVNQLSYEQKAAGTHSFIPDYTKLQSGIYTARMRIGNFVSRRRFIIFN
ncbi:MAG: T9SS type A sorting domain-containing protein [Calditrichaeota bacterium]|nr:T9SS type A sorting domain-containing protein [Calditrichota bacterium]